MRSSIGTFFSGFASCRALTYSIDLKAVMRLYGRIGIPKIECVVGTQTTLDGIEEVLAAHQIVIEATTDVVR